MKEHSIIFSGPSIVAIQQNRKFQTRRVVKPQPKQLGSVGIDPNARNSTGQKIYAEIPAFVWGGHHTDIDALKRLMLPRCPYGVPGDRLWVREGWSTSALGVYPCPPVWYRADFDQHDDPAKNREHTCPKEYQDPHSYNFGRYADCFACAGTRESKFWWHSSIHMPQKFARLLLEITDVRVQRVQEISEADADAEGVERLQLSSGILPGVAPPFNRVHPMTSTYVDAYAKVWDSINSKRGFPWSANPWVWVLSFQRVSEAPHA